MDVQPSCKRGSHQKSFFPKQTVYCIWTLYASIDEAEDMGVQPSCKKVPHQKSFFPKQTVYCIWKPAETSPRKRRENRQSPSLFFAFYNTLYASMGEAKAMDVQPSCKNCSHQKSFFFKTDCILHLDTLYSSMDEAEAMDVQPSCKKCPHQKSFFHKGLVPCV